MGKTRSYKKAHSGSGNGSKGYGENFKGSRPPAATHGTAPNKSPPPMAKLGK